MKFMNPFNKAILLFAMSLIWSADIAHAEDEQCKIVFAEFGCGNDSKGNGDSRGRLYQFNYETGSNSGNEDRCKALPIPYKAQDLVAWATAGSGGGLFGNQGTNNRIGPLTEKNVEIDNQGNLVMVKERKLLRCYRKCNGGSCRNNWYQVGQQIDPPLATASCSCGSGLVLSNGVCVPANPVASTEAADLLDTVTSGYVITQNQTEHDSNGNNLGQGADRAAMAAGGSLADQGLMAKTIDSTKSAVGAGNLGGTIGSLLGGMIGSGSSASGSENGNKGGSNGSAALGVGDTLGDKQVIAAIDGATYQGGKSFTGNLGRDGQSAAGSAGYGGRAFSGSGMEGGSGISANGQTPGMEFGGRKPASAGGSGDESAMLGEDPDDYFARINLGDNLFKIVEKRYRTKQTGWVLSKPAAVLKK